MRIVSIWMVLLVALATLHPGYGQEECTATFSVDLTSQVDSVLHYKVMVSTDGQRAQVRYNLLLRVISEAGVQRIVKVPRLVKIGQGAVFDIVRHSLAAGESLLGTEVELVSCTSEA